MIQLVLLSLLSLNLFPSSFHPELQLCLKLGVWGGIGGEGRGGVCLCRRYEICRIHRGVCLCMGHEICRIHRILNIKRKKEYVYVEDMRYAGYIEYSI